MTDHINFSLELYKEIYKKLEWFKPYNSMYKLHYCLRNSLHSEDGDVNPYHFEGDVWSHTILCYKRFLEVLNHSGVLLTKPEVKILTFAILLHDIGKPYVRDVNNKTRHVRFFCHDSLGSFKVIAFLNEFDLTDTEKMYIIKLINLHSEFHNNIHVNERNCDFTFTILASILRICDSAGKITMPDVQYKNKKDIILSYSKYEKIPVYDKNRPNCIIMTGLPRSGKTTYLSTIEDLDSYEIISLDNMIKKMYNIGIDANGTYDEAFNYFITNKEFNKEVKKAMENQLQYIKKHKLDVIVDKTNLPRKSRKRYINIFKDWNKKCVVVLTDEFTQNERNEKSKEQGKYIPKDVIEKMKKSFRFPLYSEGFYEIETVFT